jgi:hypothetical protein
MVWGLPRAPIDEEASGIAGLDGPLRDRAIGQRVVQFSDIHGANGPIFSGRLRPGGIEAAVPNLIRAADLGVLPATSGGLD